VDTAQGSSYQNPGGVIYVVAGGGGRALYATTNTDPLIRSAFSVFHTVAVDVVGDSLYVQAVEPDGTVFDSFSVVKSFTTGVLVVDFIASGEDGGIRLRWRASGAGPGQTFRLYRGVTESTATERLNGGEPVPGGPEYSYLDSAAEPGRTYTYRIAARDAEGHETWVASTQGTARGPIRLSMGRPRPNPFDRRTEVAFTLPGASGVRVTITDVHGRRVRGLVSGVLDAGAHAASWDGRDDAGRKVAAGIYFITLEAGTDAIRSRLVLLR
jgi:hypothetical protein